MGVHGLWDLLSPVGRRVSVETLAGKRLAIDASIWMVQFMKAMRDERGEMIRNAHLIGFFRRICKLLFLRTKPVFVFDGGTPALKRRTVIARRRQRENAQAKVRKTAEKLLLNQVKAMRLKELADNLQGQRDMNNSKDMDNSKGKEVMLEKSDSLEKTDSASKAHNQEMVDEMLAASIAAEESGDLGTASSCAAEIGSSSRNASTSASGFPREDEDDEDDEEMILPMTDGKVDPAVLAALPPSMQLDLLVQMRERLMAENRQKYQKVKKAPQNFSELQIEAYLKTVAFRREIDQVQKAAAGKGVGGVQTSRIASETNREFIFSSSFSGDKQLLASGGAAKIPENQQGGEKKDFSFDILNAMTSVTKSNTEAEPANNEDVETFIDETGCRRVSKGRAMGIRMTRDLQRNIDLMKELEQERTPVNYETDTQVTTDMDGQSGGSHCYGNFCKAANEFNDEIVQNSIMSSSLKPETHKNAQMNESCIEISFEDDGRQRYLDNDDEFFAHLVAGDPIPTCTEDNSTSDCEWEDVVAIRGSGSLTDGNKWEPDSFHVQDGNENDTDVEWEDVVISRGSGSLTDGNKWESDSFHAQDGNENDTDVEWEEGTNSEKFSMQSSDAEGCKNKYMGNKRQEGHVDDIHEDDRLFAADFQKIVSKGSAEEEAALQEAIKRSLEDSTIGKSSCVSGQRKASDLSFNMQMQLKSCSSLPRSHGESVLDDDKKSQSFVSECDQSSFAAEKDINASSSLGMHSTPVACVTAGKISHRDMKDIDEYQKNAVVENALFDNLVKGDSSSPADMVPCLPSPITENFVDDVATNGGASIYNSGEVIEHSTGKKVSLEEEQMHSDVKVTIEEDDTSAGSAQERSHDVKISSFNEKETILEPQGSSFEDELLVLGEEYNNLGDEQRKLERNADSVNAEMFVECQELLQMFGLPYIIAPMEAEAQCAFLELVNLVDGVVTDDSDVFLFGAKSVYKNIFDDRKYVETYFMKDIESELGLDREKLIRMALLLGSDYTEGVSGIGIVNAIEVVNAFPEEDGLHKFRDWIESPDPAIFGKVGGQSGMSSKKKGSKPSKNVDSKSDAEENSAADPNTLFDHEDEETRNDIQKTKQTFMHKHRNVSKNWHVPSSFPSDAVISAYVAPQVDKSNEPFAWGKPDIFSLRRLCWEKFAWASQKADELLLPVLKEYNKHETQLRLEAFYTFNERFAKIRSKRIQKAVKGIVGKPSLDLDVADDLQDNSAEREKTEEPAGGNRRKKSHLKRKDHVGERKNSAKKLKSQKDNGNQNEGLLTEAESISLHAKVDRQSLNDAGSSRGRGRGRRGGRGRRTSIKSSRQKESFDSECGATSISSSDEDELEVLAGNIKLPDSVRRSKRVRQAANYLEQDEESDGLTTPLNTKKKKSSDAGAGEQQSSHSIVLEADMANASVAKDFQSDDRPEHGSPENHLVEGGGFCAEEENHSECMQMGGGFCAEEDEAGKETHSEYLQMGGGFCAEEDEAGEESHSEYLQMDGGFCVKDEDDLDFQECDGGGASDITDAYISSNLTEVEKVVPTINPHETVAASTSVPESSQHSQKDPLSDSRLNLGDKHEAIKFNLPNVAVPVTNDSPTTVNPFSAIPLLKKKKRKT